MVQSVAAGLSETLTFQEVTGAGLAIAGTATNFSSSVPGTLSAPSSTTVTNGTAQVTFNAPKNDWGASSSATVTLQSGAISIGVTVNGP